MTKVLLIFIILFSFKAKSQSGEWTWISGSTTLEASGVFGTQGVPDANNKPPALWSAFYWTDSNGNFWLFGGINYYEELAALWKYDPSSNRWTWMKGPSSINQSGVYGTQGIPSSNNYPGSRAWGSCSWADSDDNLWLFGGQGLDNNGDYGQLGDVWKYNIETNEWTWMAGSNNIYPGVMHGILQVPASTNTPGGRVSTRACWVDNSDKFWLFGGEGIVVGGQFSDVWRFDPSTNQWTWMQGPKTTNEPKVTGGIGVFGNNYTPGGRNAFSSWVDQSGKFWFFGGIKGYSDYLADMWAFDPITLQWAYMGGSTTSGANASSGILCEESSAFHPGNRFQNTACWVDQYGRFWHFGGFNLGGSNHDLWSFDPITSEWTWVAGTLALNPQGNYGTMGVPAATNVPQGSGGNAAWYDNSGNLWLYGGYTYFGGTLGALWKFTPDLECPEISILPIELIQFDIGLIENSAVLLEWSTASEINNKYYSIEHSSDAILFNTIATLQASGTINTIQKYSFIHEHPLNEVNYYRIKQTDYDGKSTYTPIKSITLPLHENVIISVQNPASNPITLDLQFNDFDKDITILLSDVFGRLVSKLKLSKSNKAPNNMIALPYLAEGIYFIHLNDYYKLSPPLKLIVQ